MGWWLHEDGGRLCATRRWRNKGVWNHSLHGYYSGNTTEHDFAQDFGFTIYEGDWGKPYAARIEVWFRPDSGRTERKLMERVCKIEGWMR